MEQGKLLTTAGSSFLMLVYLQLLYRYAYGKEHVRTEVFFFSPKLYHFALNWTPYVIFGLGPISSETKKVSKALENPKFPPALQL